MCCANKLGWPEEACSRGGTRCLVSFVACAAWLCAADCQRLCPASKDCARRYRNSISLREVFTNPRAFALDKTLYGTTEATTYSEVLAGGRRAVVHTPEGDRTLATAIQDGLIQVEVNGSMQFVNKSEQRRLIRNFEEPLAIGEKPGVLKNPAMLDPLRSSSGSNFGAMPESTNRKFRTGSGRSTLRNASCAS